MHHLKLEEIHLDAGAWSGDPEHGCVMEWVSVFAGERDATHKTDRPGNR